MNENQAESLNPNASLQIAQAEIGIPGLVPEKKSPQIIHAKTGELIREERHTDDNLADKAKELNEAIEARPWLRQLWDDVKSGDKTAIVEVVLGGLVITAALGTGVELGVRRGKDIQHLFDLVDKLKKK